MKAIYKFHIDFGRMGDLNAVFSAEEKDVKAIIGKRIYFGEVLGKHSEVFETMKKSYFNKVTTDQSFIKLFDELELETGNNPFNYLDDNDDELEEEDENEYENE